MIQTVWKRVVRFESDDGKVYVGEPVLSLEEDVGVELAQADAQVSARVLNTTSVLETTAEFTGQTKRIKKIFTPLTPGEVGVIRCIGLNYKDHAKEMKFALPTQPELFMKPASCLIGAFDTIRLPRPHHKEVDYEVELAIVIGRECRDATEEDALSFVLGYTAANDLTSRDVQRMSSQWSYCKGFDGFCPLGPALISAASVDDLSVIKLVSKLDGQIMQEQKVANMIFSVSKIIEYLSKGTTLPAGTVVLTGTPAGIGASRSPPAFLNEKSSLEITISHGIGSQLNSFV